MIHRQQGNQVPHAISQPELEYTAFFTDPVACQTIVRKFTSAQGLPTLDMSVHHMTPNLYWMHFKYITLLSVNRSCKECDTHYGRVSLHAEVNAVYRLVWRRWCSLFYAYAQSLGSHPAAPLNAAFFESLHFGHPALDHHPLASVNFAAATLGESRSSRTEVRDMLLLVNEMRGWTETRKGLI